MNVKRVAASHNLKMTFHMLVLFAKSNSPSPVFSDETKTVLGHLE